MTLWTVVFGMILALGDENGKSAIAPPNGIADDKAPVSSEISAERPLLVERAEEASGNEDQVSINLNMRILSDYLITSGLVVSDGAVIQSDALLSFPLGFYFDLWSSFGLNDADLSSDFGDEADYTVGNAGRIGDFSYDANVSYFDLIEILRIPQGDVIRPAGGISRLIPLSDQHAIEPSLRFQGFIPIELDGASSGVHTAIGLCHSWNIAEPLYIRHSVEARYDTGAFSFDEGVIGRYDLLASWKISDAIQLEAPIFTLCSPLIGAGDRETEIVFGAGINLAFFH